MAVLEIRKLDPWRRAIFKFRKLLPLGFGFYEEDVKTPFWEHDGLTGVSALINYLIKVFLWKLRHNCILY
ncbi:hypothetical protein [Mucilaginibacter sp. OK283]|jgi:hypothetical protein|uniref:hypothetical protein n=1 Tax=Mucilaginibacter sp. OK283 TaxID=1881049 RepID=UPI0008D6FE88|nr:hypothetical protein [Mucilaginibacter sp. OK283]SEO97531.1 hypothetical protein SAMN05428947_105302 [Mucilaginibacter sp. OK283]